MPGDRKHHTDKFRRCVEQVVGKGHEESAAYAICTTSLQNAGEEIFENLSAGSDEEQRLLASHVSEENSEPRTLHLRAATGQVRRETLNDKSYLVVPIVALMEGVIHAVNADTPEFVPGEVLKRAASSWIGKPVMLGHPAKGGKQCSANDFEVRKASGIGVIMKSEFDGRRLNQEAWIEEDKAKNLHPRMYETLASGGTEEVSVGAHVVTNSVGSSYNGKLYKGTWLEASGDHLAFLPGGRGACSCEMGCGTFRAASHFVTEEEIVPAVVQTLVTLEGVALDQRMQSVHEAVAKKWTTQYTQEVPEAYPIQIFDDRVIVRKGEETLSVSYTVDKDGKVTLGEPVAVKQQWVALGTLVEEAPVVRIAKDKYKECSMCQGTGSKGGNPCDCCNGEGQLKAAADRIKLEGGKYILYGTTGMRLAEHITRAAAEAHRDALDARLAVSS